MREMKVGIISRYDVPEALALTEKIIDRLSTEEVVLDSQTARGIGKEGVPADRMKADLMVTIGGDGTVLYAHHKAPEISILGINMGGRGFLAEVEPEDALEALDKLMAGELEVNDLTKLAVEVGEDRLPDALNEMVVRGAEPGRALSFRVRVDGEEVEKARGDGLIVATTTGSTAYALASGGPVIDPRLDAFVVVPLSTYRPRVMPLVLPTSSVIEVELLDRGREATITIDGQITSKAKRGETVIARRSENAAKFYEWEGKFYKKSREKLHDE